MNIYFVTSLPRTGTTSLCNMADLCGLKSIHVLKNLSLIEAFDAGYNFFADTPFYSPEFLIGILESGLKDRYNIKFIYSHREILSHQNSLNKLFNRWKPSKKIFNKISLLDNLCYSNMGTDYIKMHHNYIKKISTFYDIQMLDYSFDKGWKPFCNFIEKSAPNINLPHKNKL